MAEIGGNSPAQFVLVLDQNAAKIVQQSQAFAGGSAGAQAESCALGAKGAQHCSDFRVIGVMEGDASGHGSASTVRAGHSLLHGKHICSFRVFALMCQTKA